jgi:pimeloyl-ACP methyl ester carboxylesterase
MTVALVLVHGGGFGGRCWERMLPHIDGPVLAVDLPGRGKHPADLRKVTIADCARSIVADADDAGFDGVVLAGHSLAGSSLPAATALLGARMRHVVFIGATVPPSGSSSFDTLDPEIQAMSRDINVHEGDLGALDEASARAMFGGDLDEEQIAWMVDQLVPEAPNLIFEKVDTSPLADVPCTWIRTLHDAIVVPEKQDRFAAGIPGGCDVVDIDAAHMCMISKPRETAAILNEIAAKY